MNMKVVTVRKGNPDPVRDASTLLRTIRRLRGSALVPRGVFRFGTHKEAQEWMMRQMVRTHVRRNSKT